MHIDSLILTLVKYFGIFNHLKDYVSNQLARKLYSASVYSNISYGIEVYGSSSDTSLDRLQVIQNKLLKLLLRLDPYTSINLLHSELNILKVKDLYDMSLLLIVHASLQGDCPADVKNWFVRRNSAYNTRQTGYLEYRRARLDLGTSRVQYHASELWNILSDVIKNIPCRKYFKRSLCEKNCTGIQWIIFIILIWLGDATSFHNMPLLVIRFAWWRHQMETYSALLALCAGNSPVPGEFPAQRPVTRSFDIYFDLRPNKRLSKQSWGWWLETLSCSLLRHCNGNQWWRYSWALTHLFAVIYVARGHIIISN